MHQTTLPLIKLYLIIMIHREGKSFQMVTFHRMTDIKSFNIVNKNNFILNKNNYINKYLLFK